MRAVRRCHRGSGRVTGVAGTGEVEAGAGGQLRRTVPETLKRRPL